MPTTRSQAAGKTNGAHAAPKEAGVKRQSSTKQRGGKRAKKEEGEDVSAAKAEKEEVEEMEKKGHEEEAKPAENGKEEKEEETGKEEKEENASEEKESVKETAKDDSEGKEKKGGAKSMTEARESATDPKGFEKGEGILERGHIYFFYRPKVELEEVHSIDDVSKFFILLLPRGSGSAAPPPEPQGKPRKQYRYISVGKKRLPDPTKKREAFWAAVVAYGDDLKELASELGPKDYETKTRGERHIGEARLAGRGNYVIYAKTDGPPSSHATYLAYHLSHPSEPGEVQKELEILPSSSFVLQVKNPTTSTPPQAGLNPKMRADYPEEVIQAEFAGEGDGKGLRFVPANPVKLLDFKGAEVILIGDKEDIGQVIPEGDAKEVESSAEAEGKKLSDEEVMKEVMMDAEKFPAEALDGEWA